MSQHQRNAAEVKAREYFQVEWPTAWHRLLQKYCGDEVVTLASRFAIQYAAEQLAAERTRIGDELGKTVFFRISQ